MKKKIIGLLIIVTAVFVIPTTTMWKAFIDQPIVIDFIFTGLVRGNIINKKIHAGIKEIDNKIGGGYTYYYSAICKELENSRKHNDGFLVMDLGDNLYGTPQVYYNNGRIYTDLINLLPTKGVVLGGNLDCLYGVDVFEKRIREIDWPVLLSNVYEYGTDNRLPFVRNYYIKLIGGIKVGILGFAPNNMDNSMVLSKRQRMRVVDDFNKLEGVISQVRNSGAELLIVLSQYDIWRYPERLVKIKNFVEKFNIDVFAGLNFKEFEKKTINHKGHLITSFFGLNECTQLKKLTLKIDRKTRKLLKFEDQCTFVSKEKFTANRQVTELINNEVARIEDITRQKLAFITKTLKRDFDASAPLGSFMCDILKMKYKADVVLINSGSIRSELGRGYVTTGSLYNVIPFDNMAVELTLTGKKLKILIKTAFEENRPFQVGGLTFKLKKLETESKNIYDVENIRVGDMEIDDLGSYKVVVNSFTYSIFQDLLNFPGNKIKFLENIRKTIESYMKRVKYIEVADFKPRYTEFKK
ncbi:bifunctional metallophosphatase/5'-nucleotidase [bacterium]|nr:bifunctional metallophosphatase/5'-nucleotidase [bacterium]